MNHVDGTEEQLIALQERSMSPGDIAIIDNRSFMCCSIGWTEVHELKESDLPFVRGALQMFTAPNGKTLVVNLEPASLDKVREFIEQNPDVSQR